MPNRPKRHGAVGCGPRKGRSKPYDRNWRKARLWHLREHPLCVECSKAGLVVAATVVDHVIPHRGDERLFWLETNWQSLCGGCHASKTAKGL